jgi:predicted nucleic acid-binding protein
MYEYEDVARRPGKTRGLSPQDITDILDLIYQESHRQLVWFSWRPLSSDPGDDAILEAAIAGGCNFVVSFNERHLRAAREFGIEILKPVDLLKLIGEANESN